MKKTVLLTASMLISLVLGCGCATSSVSRNYMISASGYALVDRENITDARKEAVTNAKLNLVNNLQRFMEYKLPISRELTQKIFFSGRIANEGRRQDGYYVDMYYDFDLYNFVAQNCDFKNEYTWQLLGMEKYYSDYLNSNMPIGIWTQKALSREMRPDVVSLTMLSAIPCYSGNFALDKNIEGGFFVAVKITCLLTAVFHPQMNAKIWSGAGFIGATAFDMYSVSYEVNSMNHKLEYFENAVLSDNSFNFRIPLAGAKF
jgi:hypothetical protein